jgi:hypothetical protein
MKKMLPRKNELPASTYEAKKLVCHLGLDVQKIHACPNDCILYRGENYKNITTPQQYIPNQHLSGKVGIHVSLLVGKNANEPLVGNTYT